jgi:hypothetical protein
MPVHKVMDKVAGDKQFEFKADDQVAVAEAMDRFNGLINGGHFAYEPDGKGGGKVTRAFNPEADVVFSRNLIGG